MRRFTPALLTSLAMLCGTATSARAVDLDGDGMSDVWEQEYQVPSSDAEKDYDGTGLTNIQKSELGLDPHSPFSVFVVSEHFDFPANTVAISFPTACGKQYQLEISTDLSNWTPIGDSVMGDGSSASFTFPIDTLPPVPVFFRGSFIGDIDEDGDGLTAWEEHMLGTSDSSLDSDNDGMPDAWEFANHLDPTRDDASEDPDGDGVSNLNEYLQGTDPNHAPVLALRLMPPSISIVLNRLETWSTSLTLTNTTGSLSGFQLTADGSVISAPSFTDSDNGGPAFVWEDIKDTGTLLGSVSDADDDFESFELPFSFPFFGRTFTTAFVGSNGFVTFGAGSSQVYGYPLPSNDMPPNEIAAFHADLYPGRSGDIYYLNNIDRTVIQFDHVDRYDGNGSVTFQIILHSDGLVDLRYKDLPGEVDDATVGVQNADRDQGLTISYGENYLHSNMAIRIATSMQWFSITPAQGTLGGGDEQAVSLRLDAGNLPSGLYSGQLALSSTSSSSTLQTVPISLRVNEPPQVSIVSPADGAQPLANQPLTIQTDATDNDGTVVKVQFYADAELIGESSISPFSLVWTNPVAGSHALTARAIDDYNASRLSSPVELSVITNSDGDLLPDDWELQYFGNLDHDENGDFDGDGLTNLQEYLAGTDPTDFYNGTLPNIALVSGDHQHGPAETVLPLSLTVLLTDQWGAPLANAPVTFSIQTGNAGLVTPTGESVTTLVVRSGPTGQALITGIAPYIRGSTSTIMAQITSAGQAASVTFTERADASLEAEPDNLSFAINLPGAQSQNTVLRNTGATVLDFSCLTIASSYRFTDSHSADGPVYQWTDIGETGQLLSEISQEGDDFQEVDLPFVFPFYGGGYTKLYVSRNGFVTVDRDASNGRAGEFPSADAQPGEIAAFHTDLNPSAGGRILCLADADHVIIQFDEVQHYDESGPVTFQIILDRRGAITFQYLSMSGTLDQASIGIQNLTQDQGVEVVYRQAYVTDGLALRFTPDNLWLQVSPASGQLDPGQSIDLMATADTSHLSEGNYVGSIVIQSLADQSELDLPVVVSTNAPPTVSITSPLANAGAVVGNKVTVTAEAYDHGQVTRVDFYEGSNLVGSSSDWPFSILWTAPGPGVFSFSAVAVDDKGATATSAPRSLSVQEDSDGDGLGDEWEMANFGNLDQDGSADFDGDGHSNLDEYHNGTAANDYYEGELPYPGMLAKTRGVAKKKLGLRPFITTNPPSYYLQSDTVLDLSGGNPESPVNGTINVVVDPDSGTFTTTTEHPPQTQSGRGMDWDPSPTATHRVDYFHTLFGAEADGGAYDDPPNLVDDWEATIKIDTTLSNEYTTDDLIARTRAAIKPIPPFDAPFSIDDDATFADFQFLPGNQEGVYITQSNYAFRWKPSPNLPAQKSINWLETFYPSHDQRIPAGEDFTPISTVRHWEGTGLQTDTYYLSPTRPGGYIIQMLPGELMVDGNRDGQMSDTDAKVHNDDLTSVERPYRFWTNDDDDTELDGELGTPTEADEVPARQPDSTFDAIISKRNLEDFSRLWINLRGIEDLVSAGLIQVGLKWKTVASDAPAIKIFPSEDGEGSTKYLTDDGEATRQIAGVFNLAVRDQHNNQTVDPGGVFLFKEDYWHDLSSHNPTKCLLFEGAHEGKGELAIVFLDSEGHELATGGSVWLDLKNIKKMYERAKATPSQLSPLPYTTADSGFDESQIGYSVDGSPGFERPADEEATCLVFVHGWRLTYDDSISFGETFFKRLWWQGYKGRYAMLSWPTLTSNFSYNTSEWLAWKYGKSLNNYVEGYLKNEMPDYSINVVAHSMGNIVTGSALQRGMTVNTYLAMQAAVPSGCFSDSVNDFDQLLDAEQTKHATPDKNDQGYRLYLTDAQTRASKIVSFFNEGDFALQTGTTNLIASWWPFNTNWVQNQIDFKPDGPFGLLANRYDFIPNATQGQRSVLFFGVADVRLVVDPHEVMSFVARPRSKALGADERSNIVFQGAVNLGIEYKFGRTVDDHSGQFMRSIQTVMPLFKRIAGEVEPQ